MYSYRPDNPWPCNTCKRIVSFIPLPSYPLEKNPLRNLNDTGWAPEMPGRYREMQILDPTGIRTPEPLVIQPIASGFTDFATEYKKILQLIKICCSYSFLRWTLNEIQDSIRNATIITWSTTVHWVFTKMNCNPINNHKQHKTYYKSNNSNLLNHFILLSTSMLLKIYHSIWRNNPVWRRRILPP
jgi:hypothetical protein